MGGGAVPPRAPTQHPALGLSQTPKLQEGSLQCREAVDGQDYGFGCKASALLLKEKSLPHFPVIFCFVLTDVGIS